MKLKFIMPTSELVDIAIAVIRRSSYPRKKKLKTISSYIVTLHVVIIAT